MPRFFFPSLSLKARTDFAVRSLIVVVLLLGVSSAWAQTTILNASYDVTREFYKEFNPVFAAAWQTKTGEKLIINQSHGGSSKQARSVVDGLAADVVTLNQATDLDFLSSKGLIAADWEKKFPDNASPVFSTIVFVVRKGNPKQIKDWPDLVKPGVSVIIPNPKTSGNGRYSYLAGWGYAKRAGGEAAAKDYVAKLFKNVPVLDTGGRGATTTFAQRGIGDALLTFENEAFLTVSELGADQVEIVFPSVSILADTPIAIVDKVADKRGTRKVAQAYLDFLYSTEGQTVAARHFLRPRNPEVAAKHARRFPKFRCRRLRRSPTAGPRHSKSISQKGGYSIRFT